MKRGEIRMPRREAPAAVDAWVGEGAPEATDATQGPLKRLSIDVPESVHRRVKIGCAERGVKMSDVIREFLEREFPG